MKSILGAVAVLIGVAGIACAPRSEGPAAVAVWIDTDPSVAPGGKEVDDGFALLQAFRSTLRIAGVSVVFGNAPLEQAEPIAREIVSRFGPRDLQTYGGAAGAAELGRETDASRALAAALERQRLVVLVLGPATNVATVLHNHPQLAARMESVVAVAGRRPNQRLSAGPQQPGFRDLNFELDAEAFRVLLEAPVRLVLAPWEVSSQVWLTDRDVERLAAGTEATRWLAGPAADWLQLWRRTFNVDGFNPFDTLAVGYVADPQQLEWEELPAEIHMLPDDVAATPEERAAAAPKPYLLVSREFSSKRRVRYCFRPRPEFKARLMETLLR